MFFDTFAEKQTAAKGRKYDAETKRLRLINRELLAALKHAHEALAWHDGLRFEEGGMTADARISAAIAKAEED